MTTCETKQTTEAIRQQLSHCALPLDELMVLTEALPLREQLMVRMRFGLISDTHSTLAEIGREFHLSRERVRQIIEKTLVLLVAIKKTADKFNQKRA